MLNVSKEQNKKKKERRNYSTAMIFSVVLLMAFIFLQAMESKSATDTEQVTLTTTVAETISLSCTTPVALGTLTPGTPVYNSNVCTTTTNANGGYNLAVKRDDSDTTMDQIANSTYNITDKTAWDSTTPTSAAWTGTGLVLVFMLQRRRKIRPGGELARLVTHPPIYMQGSQPFIRILCSMLHIHLVPPRPASAIS